jgi:hypothetical protein
MTGVLKFLVFTLFLGGAIETGLVEEAEVPFMLSLLLWWGIGEFRSCCWLWVGLSVVVEARDFTPKLPRSHR